MGGRGYNNDVIGYLLGDKRTIEFEAKYKSKDGLIDILRDKISKKSPTLPIFSNTEGKIYALIGKRGDIKSIGYYDETHRLTKAIHLDHYDNHLKWHVHEGDAYHHLHGKARALTSDELEMVNRILDIWNKQRGK